MPIPGEARHIVELRDRLKATGHRSRRLKLELANELFGSDHPRHLAEVVGLSAECMMVGPLTFSEKCRVAKAQVRLRVRTEAAYMAAREKDAQGVPLPRGTRPGTSEAEAWEALGPVHEAASDTVPVDFK